MRIRTARHIAQYFKERDPGTQVTEYMIRSLMDAGEVPVIQNGYKRLTSIEAIDEYISKKLGGDAGERERKAGRNK